MKEPLEIPVSPQDKADLEKAVAILKEAGAVSIYLFGSMARGDPTRESDWDIGVEGLAPGAYFTVLRRLRDSLSRQVDLVELDDGSRFSGFLKQWEDLVRVA